MHWHALTCTRPRPMYKLRHDVYVMFDTAHSRAYFRMGYLEISIERIGNNLLLWYLAIFVTIWIAVYVDIHTDNAQNERFGRVIHTQTCKSWCAMFLLIITTIVRSQSKCAILTMWHKSRDFSREFSTRSYDTCRDFHECQHCIAVQTTLHSSLFMSFICCYILCYAMSNACTRCLQSECSMIGKK
jgi:hypothetical protein